MHARILIYKAIFVKEISAERQPRNKSFWRVYMVEKLQKMGAVAEL